ncbi:LacI family DNA-binding transcriptional regulator [Amycolatopsis taiwanensis]|uniref:LacI family transcriptional regulator n=1 Tax=Amycolatopsis taiwanensis TaxID=342230 RepID=A0A9W6VH23_9PSEU|nr:LacI family DNA-binding transcriptional regulator [Amycolatopsis taiwanensis]GLY66594.1 LacI family transcriptional regulator [Amycolatopsis taiwanensis]
MEAKTPSPRPTSADVAQRAGVSRATVSYVLNDRSDHPISVETRRRVLAAVRELGYSPNATARTLRAGRSNIVLMPMWQLQTSPATNAFAEHVSRELEAQGLRLLVHYDHTATGSDAARAWAELRPAAVLAAAQQCTPSAVQLLHRAGVSVVLLIGDAPGDHAPTVPLDGTAVARCAAEYLLDRGHQRLACLVPRDTLAELGQQRFEAVRAVARPAGVPVQRVDCDLATDSLATTITAWLDPARRPSAVYAYNDEFAHALIQMLHDTGLQVPAQVAVVGSGNFPMSTVLRPRLTTVDVPAPDLARVVASAIRRLLDGQDIDRDQIAAAVLPRLIIRESA